MIYELAPEVRAVAQKIIDRHRPELRAIRIEYVFRPKAQKRHGRRVGGTAKKIAGVNALLATEGAQTSEDLDFFLVTIAKDIWLIIDQKTREALVDHELQHCSVDVNEEDGVTLSMRGHDIEEFAAIVERHGLWSQDLEMFVSSLPAEQLELIAAGGPSDLALTISHTDSDGRTTSVDTTTGGLSRAASILRRGSGVLDADWARRLRDDDETAGQGDEPAIADEDGVAYPPEDLPTD